MKANSKRAYQVTMPTEREIVMTRVFNAPREMVFRAHVDPELVKQWWGMRSYTTHVEQLDARAGGRWRFVSRSADGSQQGFGGEFKEMKPPESFTWTFEWDGMPGHSILETYSFEEHDGKTTLTARSFYSSREERDGMVATGMEAGANETGDRLDELFEKLQV